MAAIPSHRPQREQRLMHLKVVYTLESNTHHTLVARIPQQFNVSVLPPPKIRGARARREAAGSQLAETTAAPSQRFAVVTLKQCLSAICTASPDLIMDSSKDYILYAVDAVENYKIALSNKLKRTDSNAAGSSSSLLSSPAGSSRSATSNHRSVLSGKGYFSRALEEHGDGTSTVNGRIVGASLLQNFLSRSDDDEDEENEDEEDEETLEVVLRLKEAERSSRDRYLSILGGLQQQDLQQSQQSQVPPQQFLQTQLSPRIYNTAPAPSPTPLAIVPATSATPVLVSTSTIMPSAGHTPLEDTAGLSHPSFAGTNDPSCLAPSPGTQAQLLSLLHMLQQRQPASKTAEIASPLLVDPAQVSSGHPTSEPSTVVTSLPASDGTHQQQLAQVLGGLTGMMGIALLVGLLPPAQNSTGSGASAAAAANFPTPQPLSDANTTSINSPLGSAPTTIAKCGSLDAIAEQKSRKTKRRVAPVTTKGELLTAGPSSLLGATVSLLNTGGAAASSRATPVDGDNASVTSGRSEKKERKYARRVARERAAAAAVAERDRVAATPPAIEAMTPHPASEAGPIPTKKVSARLGGKKGKKQDVRAGAAALVVMQPPAKVPSSSQKEVDFSSSTTKVGAFSSLSRQGGQVSFPQSSPIRHSSSSDATKVNSSLGDVATPMTSSISRFAFPKHLLQSSPGPAFDSLLSENDLDFDGFAIPHGLFGSPSLLKNTLGGGSSSRQSGAADDNAEDNPGRCPSTPLRRSPRKHPTGTHASMNPYASLNTDHDLFGCADHESPLFGFVNMLPATARSGSHSSRLKTLDGLTSSGEGRIDDTGPNDPFGSPSAYRAQRRLPSGQGNKTTPSGSKDAEAGSIASLSALMVSPNLNEVDFAALLRANVSGAGGASANLNGALEGHALLTGSPSGPPRTDMG